MEALKKRLAYLAERYICTLNKDDLAVAVLELNEPENDDERLKRIDNLRDAFMNKNKDLTLIRSDDGFLLRFLRAKKFHHSRALNLLTNYHTRLPAWPGLFEKIGNPQLIKHVYDAGCFVALDCHAKDGSAVCIGRPGKIKNILFEDFLAVCLHTYEKLLEDERVQIYGITVINDMTHVGFHMLTQLCSFTVIKRTIGVIQDCMPIRMKSLNFVFQSALCDVILYALLVLPVHEKMKKRVQFHGRNFKPLHKIVDASALPPAYGGTGNPIDGIIADSWRDAIFGEHNWSL